VAHSHEVRDGSVVCLTGCHQQMVIRQLEGDCARCIWFDMDMKRNEFPFPLHMLERVSW
jgi:hypothetical protein